MINLPGARLVHESLQLPGSIWWMLVYFPRRVPNETNCSKSSNCSSSSDQSPSPGPFSACGRVNFGGAWKLVQ